MSKPSAESRTVSIDAFINYHRRLAPKWGFELKDGSKIALVSKVTGYTIEIRRDGYYVAGRGRKPERFSSLTSAITDAEHE
jgi:hypothetical protein